MDVPVYWRATFPAVDRYWAAKAIFSTVGGKCEVSREKGNRLWFDPPAPKNMVNTKPQLASYFGHRILFWQPRRLWSIKFTCPMCTADMKANGLCSTVRFVLDIDSFYILVG